MDNAHGQGHMSEIAQKLPKKSMPDVYSVILEYYETQEAEIISRITIIVRGWVSNFMIQICSTFMGFLGYHYS